MIIKKSFFHTISKFMICLLCCFMLFSLISKPIIAQASVTATVAIGAYGVIKVVLSSKVLVGLIIGSFSGFIMSGLVADIDDWYESDSTIRNWADQYNGAITGGEVINIPSDVQERIRTRYNVPSTISLHTMYVPYDLTHLENVSAANVFGADVAAQLEANNLLVRQTNTILGRLVNTINTMASTLTASIDNIRTTFISEFSQFKTWYVNINENLKSEVHQIPNWLSDINTNVKSEFKQVKDWLSSLNTNMKNEIKGVKTLLSQMKDTAIANVNTSINNMTESITSILVRIENRINAMVDVESIAPPPSSGGSGDSGNTVNSGVNNGLALFGQSNGILAEYATAFLVATLIFNLFAEISIFNKLLIVSASIGLVGVFLGLAFNAVQADNSARKEAEREARREAYRQSRYKRKGG